MAGMDEKYDSAFLGILQNEGQIANFLDSIFGFLYRRTDFYRLMTQKDAKMGFPPGVAKKIVLGAFKKWEERAKLDEEKRQKIIELQQKKLLQQQQSKQLEAAAAPTVAQVPETVASNVATKLQGAAHGEPSIPVASPAETPKPSTCSQQSASGDECQVAPSTDQKPRAEKTLEKDIPKERETRDVDSMDGTAKKPKTDGEDEDENPELTKIQKVFQDNPESYNGAIRDNYSWSQGINDVDIRVNVPKYIQKGSGVRVDIARKHLKVSYRDESGNFIVVVDEALCWDVNKEESMWTLVPGEHVHVNLEKIQERWWEAVLEGEPKISVRKIDPSRPMTDLDDEAQAKIEEMMYNEHRKRLGLPQSHEEKVHDVLKRAWDAEGSPFKGQPFDPSKLNVSPNSAF